MFSLLEADALLLGGFGVELEAVGYDGVGGAAREVGLKSADVGFARLFVLRVGEGGTIRSGVSARRGGRPHFGGERR